MDKDYSLHRGNEKIPPEFPVHIFRVTHPDPGPIMSQHWHEQIQIFYFLAGEAVIYCNSRPVAARPGVLVITNSNELHYGENQKPPLVYYAIKIDFSFLLSNQVDLCQAKYITPLIQNRILFHNRIDNDNTLLGYAAAIIREYEEQRTGYEMAVKACAYNILVQLLRHHVAQQLHEEEYARQAQTLQRFREVLTFIDQNYTEQIALERLAAMAGISSPHFCRQFKKLTGSTAGDHINRLRINKAVELLTSTALNITEIALDTGFGDINYFSRLFKKYKGKSPRQIRSEGLLAGKVEGVTEEYRRL